MFTVSVIFIALVVVVTGWADHEEKKLQRQHHTAWAAQHPAHKHRPHRHND